MYASAAIAIFRHADYFSLFSITPGAAAFDDALMLFLFAASLSLMPSLSPLSSSFQLRHFSHTPRRCRHAVMPPAYDISLLTHIG